MVLLKWTPTCLPRFTFNLNPIHAGSDWDSTHLPTDCNLWTHSLQPDWFRLDSRKVLLVSFLHVLHFHVLHILWDDGSCHDAKQWHCSHSLNSILCNLEHICWFSSSSTRKLYWTLCYQNLLAKCPLKKWGAKTVVCLLQKIPVWWRWYSWACPVAWTLYGLVASQFGDYTYKMDNEETVQDFIRRFFGFRHDFLGVVAVAVVGFTVLFAFVFAFSIRVFNFQRRWEGSNNRISNFLIPKMLKNVYIMRSILNNLYASLLYSSAQGHYSFYISPFFVH